MSILLTTFLMLWNVFVRGEHHRDPVFYLHMPNGSFMVVHPGTGGTLGHLSDPSLGGPDDERGPCRIQRYFRTKRAFVGEYVLATDGLFATDNVRYVLLIFGDDENTINYFRSFDSLLEVWNTRLWGQVPIVWKDCHLGL